MLQVVASNRAGLGAFDGLMFGFSTFCAAMTAAYGLLRWRGQRKQSASRRFASRLSTALASTTLLVALAARMTPLEFEGLAVTAIGCLLALLLVD